MSRSDGAILCLCSTDLPGWRFHIGTRSHCVESARSCKQCRYASLRRDVVRRGRRQWIGGCRYQDSVNSHGWNKMMDFTKLRRMSGNELAHRLWEQGRRKVDYL